VEGLDIGQGRERGGGTRHWTRERERWRDSTLDKGEREVEGLDHVQQSKTAN
jgi:hypothetical protein